MSETKIFPYLLTTTREQGSNSYTTRVTSLIEQKQLSSLSGKVLTKELLGAEIYLLKMEPNATSSEKEEENHYFVVLWGNNVLTFSKYMQYCVSPKKKRISIVDQGRPTFIEY